MTGPAAHRPAGRTGPGQPERRDGHSGVEPALFVQLPDCPPVVVEWHVDLAGHHRVSVWDWRNGEWEHLRVPCPDSCPDRALPRREWP